MAKAKINTEDAVKEVNALIDVFNNLVSTTNKVGGASAANFRKVETGLAALKNVSTQVDSQFKELETRYKNMSTSQKNYVTQVKNLKDRTKELNAEIVKQQIELEKLSEKQKKATSGFGKMFESAKALIGAFGIISGFQLFAAIIKNAYDLTKQFNSLSFTLEKITQDSFDAAASQRFMLDITQAFGVELVTTTQRWIKFLAASKQSGVTLKDTEDIFRSVTKAASVLGLQTEELNSVYLALEQMMSKGKVTTEELRRQLGERLPGAVGIMAAAVGVNVSQLDKMLKNGELLSAEVLPKFARALEQAYGIENVDKVETIVAAQNRLTNAWEIFVKSVTEGDTVITRTLNGMSRIFSGVLSSFMSEDQKLQQSIIQAQKDFQETYETAAEKSYNNVIASHKKMWYLRNAIEQTQSDILTAKSDGSSAERKMKLFKQLEEYRFQLAHGNELILNMQKNQAQKDIVIAKNEYEEKKIIYDKAKKLYESIPWYKTQHGEKNQLDKAAKEYAVATGKLEYLRKLTEVSRVSTYTKPEPKAKEKAIQEFELKSVNDLNNEVKIASLNARKELNEALIADDKKTWSEKLALIKENTSIELDIAKIQQDEAIAKAQKYHDDQIHDLDKAIKDGKKIIGDKAKWELEIEDNLNDAKALAQADYNKKEINSKKKNADETLRISKLVEEEEISISNDLYNKRIIAAKAEYNASKKTKEDKEKLEKELTAVAIEEANARIEILIKNTEALIESGGLTQQEIDVLKRKINELRASMKEMVPTDDIKDKMKELQEVLEMISEFAEALTDVGDSLFDRKIENINAEIEAEKNKYDTLIDLAKGNQDEQDRLAAEKELKVKALERERLKQEQRKAKFDKANALVQIGINTAIAASRTVAEFPLTGGMPWFAWVIALGAIQAAAVLAKPIPQYKDGLDNASEDHIAMINDGGVKEFVERDGKILSTENKNAIVQLKKGDTVHKSYDAMIASSDILKDISRATMLTSLANKNGELNTRRLEEIFDSNFKDLNKDLKNGIRDGFKGVSIHNHTTYDMNWIKYKNDTL